MSDSTIRTDGDIFLRRHAVVQQTGLSSATIYRLIERGAFPKPRRYIGLAGSFWLQSEIRDWQASQLAAAA